MQILVDNKAGGPIHDQIYTQIFASASSPPSGLARNRKRTAFAGPRAAKLSPEVFHGTGREPAGKSRSKTERQAAGNGCFPRLLLGENWRNG